MRCKILFWDSDKICRVITKNIKQGETKVKIKKKWYSWMTDKVKPYFFEHKHKWLGFLGMKQISPLYVFRHNDTAPYEFDWDEKQLKTATRPETQDSMMKQNVVKTMLELSTNTKLDVLMWLIIGGLLGGMGTYIYAIGGFG